MSSTAAQIDHAGWLGQARAEIRDLTTVNPATYWVDYTLSMLVGYSAGAAYLLLPFGTWLSVGLLIVAALATYRAAMFLHEVVHFRHNEMRTFKTFWNLTGGVVMLMPSFLYESHLVHHSSHHYGTEEDGEYLPLGRGTIWGLFAFMGQVLFLPIFVFLRFLIGTPLSFLHAAWRRWTVERASSFVINFRYRRKIPEQLSTGTWMFLEWACWLRAFLPVLALTVGLAPPTRLPKLYLLAVVALGLNHLRTLAAHRYCSVGDPMSHTDQFLDSTNIKGGWLTELICPVGLRYHGLHHLFPAIPYHNLTTAHQRLMTSLPEPCSYRETEYASVFSVLRELLRNTWPQVQRHMHAKASS